MCLGLKPRVHDGRCRRIHGAMVAPLRNQKCWNICSIVNSLHLAFISLHPFTVYARTKRFLCSYINARQCEFVNSSFSNLWTFVSLKIEPSNHKNIRRKRKNHKKCSQRLFRFCQSDEISSNLVTLMLGRIKGVSKAILMVDRFENVPLKSALILILHVCGRILFNVRTFSLLCLM